MGAFNILHAAVPCARCGVAGSFDIQFKFGDTWQYEYEIGDDLRWSGNDHGARSEGVVRLEGIGGPCRHCSADFLTFVIAVVGNRLTTAEPQ